MIIHLNNHSFDSKKYAFISNGSPLLLLTKWNCI
jgi:hypothetical protein